MSRKWVPRSIWLVFAFVILVGGVTLAASGSLNAIGTGFDLSWWTVDGGGDTATSGGQFTLGGTIGQHDASSVLAAGDFTLRGGFWGREILPEPGYPVYLPLVLK